MKHEPTGDHRITMCRTLIQIRLAVGDSLSFKLCPSPIWDMLLDLYLAQHERREVYLWPLCMASNTPISTAHRKIKEMERKGLLLRESGDGDRRRIGIKLTEDGKATVTALLDRIDRICHAALQCAT